MTRKILSLGLFMVGTITPTCAQQEAPISDRDIKVDHFEILKYPVLARQTRMEGVLVVRVKLDDTGKVVETTALSGDQLLVHDCLENVKKWHFHPNGHHAAVIVYNFRLAEWECQTEPSLFMFQRPNFATISGCEIPLETSGSQQN